MHIENEFEELKPGTLLAPVPAVLVSCARPGEKPNLITLAWVGTVNSEPPMCSVSVRPERYSHPIIAETGEFIINLVGKKQMRAADFCGVKSGRDTDKFSECGLHALPVEGFTAPAVAECPIYLACRVVSRQLLGSHEMFIGRIERMGVKKELMDETGRVDFARADLIAYNHGAYYGLGNALGFFGCSVAGREVYQQRMKQLRPDEPGKKTRK